MRSYIITIILWIALFTPTAFSQTANVNQGCFPFEVDFTPPPGMGSYFWDFDNGTTSTLENPSATFTSAGTFTVELYNQPGGTLVGTVEISSFPPPEIEIFASPAIGCAPLEVTFTYNAALPQGVSVLEHQWVFGDGGSLITPATSVTYTFVKGGTYSASLELVTSASSCNVTKIFTDVVVVEEEPDMTIISTPDPPQSCNTPFDITFTPAWTDAVSYQWDFGNGNTSTLQNPPAQTYSDGNFLVTLTATSDLGCVYSSSQQVSGGSPEVSIEMPDTLCIDERFMLVNNNPPLFFFWDFGPGSNPQFVSGAAPTVTFEQEGWTTVTLTATSLDQTCSTVVTKDIYIEKAVADFTTAPSFSCINPLDLTATATNANNDWTYNWYFNPWGIPDSIINGGPVVSMEFIDSSEFYPYSETGYNLFVTSLVVETPAGCKAFASNSDNPDTIALYKANFFESAVEGCIPLDVTFEDASTNKEDIIRWDWFVDDVLVQSNTTDAPFEYEFTERGEYDVYLVITTDNPMCPGDTSAIHTIEVGQTYSTPLIVCGADTPPSSNVPVLVVDQEIIIVNGVTIELDTVFLLDYSEIVIIDNGCVSSFEITLPEIIDLNATCGFGPPGLGDYIDDISICPSVDITGCSIDCNAPFTVNLDSENSNATSILWDFGDGTTSTNPSVTHTYANTGDFLITLTAFNSSDCIRTKSVKIHIRDVNVELESFATFFCSQDSTLLNFDAINSTDVHETCSTGYTWDFLNDDFPPFRSSTPLYSDWFFPGTFDVLQLVGTDINGCTDTTRIPINIYGAQMDMDISDMRICTEQEISFTNLSELDTTIVSLEWDFGDGNTSTDENPTHTYTTFPPSNNEYLVTLTIEDLLGCTYEKTDTIDYYNFFTPIFSDSTACLGQPFTVSANNFTSEGSFLVYEWDFGNNTTGTGQTTDVIYNDVGIFDITLTYYEESSGCTRIVNKPVEVVPFPEASFVSDNDDSNVLCYPANVFFTNTSTFTTPVTYLWDFGNGETSELENPATVFEEGEYTVTLYVTNELGCQDVFSKNYTILNPQGSFSLDRNTICKGESITFELSETSDVSSFTWDFGDGVTVSDVNPVTHTYDFHPPGGTTVATLILYSDGQLCPFSADTTIFIQEVIADFVRNEGLDTAICFAPYTFENISQNADSYLWDFGDGNTSTELNPSHEYDEPGAYEVSLYITNAELGCNDTITYPVILHPNPVTQISGDTLCFGDEIEMMDTTYDPDNEYEWTPQDIITGTTDSSIFISPTSSTTVYLSEETEFGCTDQDSASILVVATNSATDFDTIIVMGDSAPLPVEYDDYFIFEWTPETGLSCTDCSYPLAGPLLEDAVYELNITDAFGCFESDITFTIAVHPESFINMPTTFTPNGDGNNDVMPVFGWGIKELMEYQVFNRWGEKVFETSDLDEGWDGTFNGVPQNPDVYGYRIRALNWKDEEMTKEGFINLVR